MSHQRPEHAYGTAIRHYHQRNASVVGLTGKLDRDERTIVEPVSSDGQRARVPDERAPAQARDVRQWSLPSLIPGANSSSGDGVANPFDSREPLRRLPALTASREVEVPPAALGKFDIQAAV